MVHLDVYGEFLTKLAGLDEESALEHVLISMVHHYAPHLQSFHLGYTTRRLSYPLEWSCPFPHLNLHRTHVELLPRFDIGVALPSLEILELDPFVVWDPSDEVEAKPRSELVVKVVSELPSLEMRVVGEELWSEELSALCEERGIRLVDWRG